MFDRITRIFKRQSGPLVVIGAGGGHNACHAPVLLPGLAGARFVVLHVERPGTRGRHVLEAACDRVRAHASSVTGRRIVSSDVRASLVEASRDADLLVLGTSLGPAPASDPLLSNVARRARCPVALVRGPEEAPRRSGRVLVVGERSGVGRIGFERAVRWSAERRERCDAILGPGDDPFAMNEEPWTPDEGVHSVLESGPVDAGLVLDAVRTATPERLVLVVDPDRLGGSQAWVDDVVVKAPCAVACVAVSRRSPRTKRRELLTPAP